MGSPEYITFTGVDENTDLDRCIDIAERFDHKVEWGILASFSNKAHRYPNIKFLRHAIQYLDRHSSVAVHLCGEYAREANAGNFDKPGSVLHDDLYDFVDFVPRWQINLVAGAYDLIELQTTAQLLYTTFIIQNRTSKLPENAKDEYPNLRFVQDCSGGKGRLIDVSKSPVIDDPDYMMGYAGGIGPDNVVDVVDQIQSNRYWIDMESSLRNESDWFDLDRVEKVCELVYGNV